VNNIPTRTCKHYAAKQSSILRASRPNYCLFLFSTSTGTDLFQAEEDKYAVFRMISTETDKSNEICYDDKQIGVVFSSLECKEDSSEFADFASFQTSSEVVSSARTVTINSQTEAAVVRNQFESLHGVSNSFALSSHMLPSSLSSTIPSSNCLTAAVGADKYEMIKQLVGNSALFKSSPMIETDIVKSHADADDEWAEFQSLPSAGLSHGAATLPTVCSNGHASHGDHNVLFSFHNNSMSMVDDSKTDNLLSGKTNFVLSKISDADQERDEKQVRVNFTGQQAEFQTSSVLETQVHLKSSFEGYLHVDKQDKVIEPKVDWLDPSKVSRMFAKQSGVGTLGIATSYSSGALDFSPPEFPSESDDRDDDDFGFFQAGTKQKSMLGVSSLSNIDFEEDFEDKTTKLQIVGKGLAIGRITESMSTSSFEFTGWTASSLKVTGHADSGIKAIDSQSTDSFDFQPSQVVPGSDSRSQDDSPSRDSRSVSSLEFSVAVAPTVVAISSIHMGLADAEVKSVRSLELKSSPDDLSSCTHEQYPDVSPSDVESQDFGYNSQFTGSVTFLLFFSCPIIQ